MSKLIATFQERFGDWVAALGQHLQLSLLTLLLAIFLSAGRENLDYITAYTEFPTLEINVISLKLDIN